MPSRRQRTKQLNSLTFERIDALFEVSETQSIIKIVSFSIYDKFYNECTEHCFFFPENIDMIDDVTNQNDFIEQMKQRLTIIEIEKSRAHLKHRLIQIKTKKKTDFSVTVFEISKSSRKNVEF